MSTEGMDVVAGDEAVPIGDQVLTGWPEEGGFVREDEPRGGGEPPTTPPASSSSPASTSPNQLAELRRVKVYVLKGTAWIDRGTGHCQGIIEPGPPPAGGGALGLSGMGLGSPFLSTGPPSPGGPSFDDPVAAMLRDGRSKALGGLGGEARIEVRKEATDVAAGGELLLRSKVIRPVSIVRKRTSPSDGEEEEEDHANGERPRKRAAVEWPEGGGIYQRQQDTLVVWTEPDGTDMALSFATPEGCQEMWRFLCEAQEVLGPAPASVRLLARRKGGDLIHWDDEDGPRRIGPDDDDDAIAFDLLSTSSHSSSGGFGAGGSLGHATSLPSEPTLSNIADADVAIKLAARTAQGREKVCAALLKTDFIPKLEGVFKDAEDVESVGDLHGLCILMQTILTLNDAAIYEYVVLDEIVLGVASILEYDPEFGDHKASYRAHLADTSRFREVVPIRDAATRAKIHQTYRLQYFRDVILARILDDPTFSILSTLICFNQIDIATHLQGNEAFLKELFDIFQDSEPEGPSIGPSLPPHLAPASQPPQADDDESGRRKDDAMLFLQQLCSMAKHLQAGARAGFYRSLCDHGLLNVLEAGLARVELDPAIRSATCEVLVTVIDHDPNSVRGHCLKQQAGKKRTLVTFLIELLIQERDLGLKVQLVEALRILVDAGGEAPRPEMGLLVRKEEDPEAERFLQYFYDHCVSSLVQPLSALPELSEVKDRRLRFDSVQVALFNHLCDMLGFFVTHHTFRSKYFILSSTVSVKVATLLRTRYKHLRLAALRYFRACISKNDDFYNRYLFKNDLFSPIVQLAEAESGEDNLLSSACLEFFEHLRMANAKAALNHLMDTNGPALRRLAERLPTFRLLVLRSEQNNEPAPKPPVELRSEELKRTQTINIGQWSRSSLDVDEDRYFNDSDSDDDEKPPAKLSKTSPNGRKSTSPSSSQPAPAAPKPMRAEGSPLFGLLEYGDDDSGGEDEAAAKPMDVAVPEALPDSAAPPASPSIGTSALPLEPSPSSSRTAPLTRTTSAAQLGNLSGETPPTLKPGERRQREEEADDQLGLLGSRAKREKTDHRPSPPTMKLNGLGGAHHSAGPKTRSQQSSSASPPIGKIRLSLASSTANRLAAASANTGTSKSASPPRDASPPSGSPGTG